MSITKYLIILGLGMSCCGQNRAFGGGSVVAGPLFANFPLTLDEGNRTEILGPLYYSEQKESQHIWAVPPLGLSYVYDTNIEYKEFNFLYPLFSWNDFGREYRCQIFQFVNFGGGRVPEDSDEHRFTLFPIYFQQRSANPEHNYTAVLPFYGHLDHRLFRDEIDFVMYPFYIKSREKDVVTRNMPYPLFHLREGIGLKGWQLWPLVGAEHKVVTMTTNGFGDAQVSGGHDHYFVLWPIFSRQTDGLGTSNPSHELAVLPFFDYFRSALRDTTCYLWPLGVTHIVDRDRKFEEWDAPWPLVEFAHGEGKTTHQVLPFFSDAWNDHLKTVWVLWPFYKYNRVTSAPMDYRRTRILFFLFSAINMKNTETGLALRREDFWPLYTRERDYYGNERLQVLSVFEPFFPGGESVVRDYNPLCALWRHERSPERGTASESLLWNLYRRDAAPKSKKISLLFGLFQYQSSPDGAQWRVFYIPAGGTKARPAPKPAAG